MDPARLLRAFTAEFGTRPELFSAPGRVNLIGEHTDYNDGFVLPMAIDRRTYVAAARRADRKLVAHSLNLDSRIQVDLDQPGPPRRGAWIDYVEGTARALAARGFALTGADLLIESEVPPGAGLSASAALELALGYALSVLGGAQAPDRVALALAGQAAEHEYAGILCGIMDQFVAALGERGSALLIDCRTLEHARVELALGSACVLVCDTKVKHQLAASEYNTRRRECEAGVALLAERLPGVRALRDVSAADLTAHQQLLPEIVARRCRHVVHENARTEQAARALAAGELGRFGQLMRESHRSLRDDFEVSSPELDCAVETALLGSGVYGARMTGGGFGGCTVTLLERSAVPDVSQALSSALTERFGLAPDVFVVEPSDGARRE